MKNLICVDNRNSEGRLTKGKLYDVEHDINGMIFIACDDTKRGGFWWANRFENIPEVDVRTCFKCKMTSPASDEGGDEYCNHMWIDP